MDTPHPIAPSRRPSPALTHACRTLMLLSGLSLPASALAQQQVGSNGRALDANPQVGSGGTNRLENQVDYASRNDLITGNVAGGAAFRGSINYGAPGAFRGSLGSDSLFRFRADSLGSAPAVAGQAGLNNPAFSSQARGGNVVVYNNFTAIPAGRLVQGATTRMAPEGGDFRPNPDMSAAQDGPYQVAPNNRPGFAVQTRQPESTPTPLILQPRGDGEALAVSADPLTGVTQQRAVPRPPAIPAETRPLQGTAEPGQTGFQSVPDLRGGSSSNYQNPTSPGNRDRLYQGPADNAELRERHDFADATGRVKPTLQLGQLTSNFATTNPSTIEQRVAQLQSQIFGRAAADRPGQDPAENAYVQLLDRIRQQAQQDADERAEQARDRDLRPEWMKAMDEPEEDKVLRAEESLQETMARIRDGLRQQREDREQQDGSESADGSMNPSGGQTSADQQARQDEADAQVDSLMSDLSYNVRLETLVAQRETRVNQMLTEAETQMSEGRFLDAERTYRQVRLEATDNPLGTVGMIHAQLGAGMIRSAAYNLRALFEEHPELIATRYGEALLPPADRVRWLQQELQRMIDTEGSKAEAGLMMAYLGHQVESRQLIRYGLAIGEEASPFDELLPVLRRIWLEGNTSPQPVEDAGK